MDRFVWFGLGLMLTLAGCAPRSANLPAGFEQFTDSDGRFAILYPNNWTFQPGPDAGVKLSDPADSSYQVTVFSGKVPRENIKSVSQFPRKQFGEQIGKTLIPRSGADDVQLPKTVVEIRKESQRTDKQNRVYYAYEIVIATAGRANHTLVTAVIDKGSLYTAIVGCSDDTWAARKEKITAIANSFQVLPAP
ncbi:PsbP-related protein [Anthocerotibacter panamensis]|uniref:PsbP-related protein n=1 Tax=Anthocerotibacter panamensis TaxID=2857077 RepID=UPI001FD92C88|nr:PsbP-related protein [Anthocerotibacter panamensis]